MISNHSRRAGRPFGKRIAARVAVALLLLSIAGPAAVRAAAATIDFGTVTVAASKTLGTTVPLTTALSDVPPGTVVYAGGNASIDLALALAGLSVPLTAGGLYGVVGEVTTTYHVTEHLLVGTDYAAEASTCQTGSVSCTVDVTFTPTDPGVRADSLTWTVSDVQVTGGGSYASLISLLAPFLAQSVADAAAIDLTGIGVPSTGSVAARVSIAASAACIELSTSAIDFGNLALGAEDQPAAPSIVITNCSGLAGMLHARGSNATGTSSAWALVDGGARCADSLGLDNYRLQLASAALPGPLPLSTDNKPIQTLASGEDVEHVARIYTACPGSTGAGRVMNMSIDYLVTGG